MRQRVVITGVGCITPLGTEVDQVWSRLIQGDSAVDYTTIFDASNFPTKISAEVKNWDITDTGEDPEVWKFRGRHTKFAAGAAKQGASRRGVVLSIVGAIIGSIVGLAIATEPGRAWYLPLRHRTAGLLELDGVGVRNLPVLADERMRPLIDLLEDASVEKVGHDLKHDLLALRVEGVTLRGVGFDAMIASYSPAPLGRR